MEGVHAKGSFIFLQTWALGRAANPDVLTEDGNYPYVSASSIVLTTSKSTTMAPRPLAQEEIDTYVESYANAATNAIEAGFDGVEIDASNGYLIDQFLQDVSNTRTDEYGGSIENRSRFGLRIVDAAVEAIGAERTGVRLSPWGRYQDMRMLDPIPQFSHFVSSLATKHPNLAYLHLNESVTGPTLPNGDTKPGIWSPRPLISCTDYTRDMALDVAEGKGDLIAFGRLFISNPDLPFRLRHNLPLMLPDRKAFYTHSDEPDTEEGYTSYAFSAESERAQRGGYLL
ncbi:hypothetical protein NMY22_g8627 [Coprinellus aureogranulatus]|nr:hypothetical protein NMY22_g8627 [Coprinellus aureogranulatus]